MASFICAAGNPEFHIELPSELDLEQGEARWKELRVLATYN